MALLRFSSLALRPTLSGGLPLHYSRYAENRVGVSAPRGRKEAGTRFFDPDSIRF